MIVSFKLSTLPAAGIASSSGRGPCAGATSPPSARFRKIEAAIEKLPGRKLILTNGTRKHADAVMRRLQIHDHFDDVFDIVAAELDPKPFPQTYARFLALHGVDASKAAMFEDLARNLEVPYALGMTTVLVVPSGTQEVLREGWELEGRNAAHVDHVTEDLVRFLEAIISV